MGVAMTARYAIPLDRFLTVVFAAQSMQTLGLGFACIIALPCLTFVRDRHPWNLVCTAIWSIAWGLFLAAAQVPGGVVRSNVLFVIFGSLTVGVAGLLVCSTCFTTHDRYTGDRLLWSFGASGLVGWVLVLVAPIVLYSQVPALCEHPGHFIAALVVASCIFGWVVYDAGKLCQQMSPDDYMKVRAPWRRDDHLMTI